MNDDRYRPYGIVGARRRPTTAEVLVEIIIFLVAVAATIYTWDW